MVHYKLVYFGARGKAEGIRYILAYGKIDYEDKRLDYETEWPKFKEETPFGQVPVLYADEKCIAQSLAIARYFARECGIDGKTSWDKARADMLVDGVNDFIAGGGTLFPIVMAKWTKDEEKFKAAWGPFKEKGLIPFLKKYTEFLKESKSGWFVGDSLTWADLLISEFVHRCNTCFEPGCIADYPELKAHSDKIHQIEQIKKYTTQHENVPF